MNIDAIGKNNGVRKNNLQVVQITRLQDEVQKSIEGELNWCSKRKT
jgi:hypothetical protein